MTQLSQSASGHVDLRAEIARCGGLVKAHIEALLAGTLAGTPATGLWAAMARYPLADSKRLRSFLAMATTRALGGDERDAIPLAVVIELIHNFTLIHDDIMDGDDERRGQPALHTEVGVARAINAGDGLFALAFKLLAGCGSSAECARRLMSEVASAALRVAEGQDADLTLDTARGVSESDYIEMAEKKCGGLFVAAARGGAVLAGAPEVAVDQMGGFAQDLGVAFQIQDDVLSVCGAPGKPAQSDVRNGKATLIVAHALERLPALAAARLAELLGGAREPDAIAEAVALVDQSGAVTYARHVAHEHAARARARLDVLPDSLHKRCLAELASFVIHRCR